MKSATERFSERVADYVKYRPGYPEELVIFLREARVLTASAVVADVGSGTGLLTRVLLDHGHQVFAIEPNAGMRAAGEHLLRERSHFHSVAGCAEDTTLVPASVDIVTAAQAFHWFDQSKARNEFRRILRPPGWVALVWNERQTSTPFLEAYETLLRTFAEEYQALNACHIDLEAIEQFFAPATCEMATFANSQRMDLEGLRGRLLSSSYTPLAHQPGHDRMMGALDALFERHAERGKVEFIYETRLYYGRLQ